MTLRKIEKLLEGRELQAFGGKPGLWGSAVRPITYAVKRVELTRSGYDPHLASLDVYLDSYDSGKDAGTNLISDRSALIYTDPTFINDVRRCLEPLEGAEVEYSEQGMQGRDYVNLDVSFNLGPHR